MKSSETDDVLTVIEENIYEIICGSIKLILEISRFIIQSYVESELVSNPVALFVGSTNAYNASAFELCNLPCKTSC